MHCFNQSLRELERTGFGFRVFRKQKQVLVHQRSHQNPVSAAELQVVVVADVRVKRKLKRGDNAPYPVQRQLVAQVNRANPVLRYCCEDEALVLFQGTSKLFHGVSTGKKKRAGEFKTPVWPKAKKLIRKLQCASPLACGLRFRCVFRRETSPAFVPPG